jgi:thioredoxin-related protein
VQVSLTVLDEARESGKPVMLFFSAPDKDSALGKQCLTFENFVLRNQKIFDEAQKFHRVKIDPTKFRREVLKQYKVKTAPTVVFLSYDGKIITKIQAKSNPTRFLQTLKAVLAKNAKLAKKAGKASS